MKKLRLLLLLMICVFLVGCSAEKTVLTGEDFVNKAKESGYTSIDIQSSYATFATTAYMIDTDFKVIFVEGKNTYDIEGIFLDECENINKGLTKSGSYKSDSGSNWAVYTATNIGNYYYVALVDNTYLYIEGKEEAKDRINKLVDNLGY